MSKKKKETVVLKEFLVFRIDGDGRLIFIDEVKDAINEQDALETLNPDLDHYEFFVIDSSFGKVFLRESVFVPA